MDEQEFAALVDRYRVASERDPRGYLWRLIAWIALGYAFVAGMIMISLGLAVGAIVFAVWAHVAVVAFKLAAPVAGVAFVMLHSMHVPMPPSEGETLGPDDAPELFRMIDELRVRVDAPRLDRVCVANGMNAGVSTTPRIGLFGTRHELVIGLSLMQALTIGQFRAVLAHELAHLSRAHGRLGAFVYQARSMWVALQEYVEGRDDWSQALLRGFLRWYAPAFNARTFVLARAHEYEADGIAASVTSPAVFGQTLVRLQVAEAAYTERIVPAILRRAREEPLPVSGVYEHNDRELTHEFDAADRRRWLERALAIPTGTADTHPSLTDRLAALGVAATEDPPGPATVTESAAVLLGDAEPAVRRALERVWKRRILQTWEYLHREAVAGRSRHAALEEKARTASLDPDERCALLEFTLLDAPVAEARERFEALLLEQPGHAPTLYRVGRLRLMDEDESGIALITRAMDLDPEATEAGCQALADYLVAHRRAAEVGPLRLRVAKRRQDVEAEMTEWNRIRPTDTFEPHGLPDEPLKDLRGVLDAMGEIEQVYLVRRRVEAPRKRESLLFAIRPKRAVLKSSARERRERIEAWFREFPFGVPVQWLFLDRSNVAIEQAIAAVPGALLLDIRRVPPEGRG